LRTGPAGHSSRDIYTIGRDAERWGRWERWWSGDRVASAADVVHGIPVEIIYAVWVWEGMEGGKITELAGRN
jgi:hypothetical protein